MLNLTFLEENQISGKNALKIFKVIGTKCKHSDFSILLGGHADFELNGWWWTKTSDGDNDARAVNYDGCIVFNVVPTRDVSARPASSYSKIASITSNKVRGSDGLLRVEYGEYPQTIAEESLQKTLESQLPTLKKTGKIYTTDSAKTGAFVKEEYVEYEYSGKKYIRIIGDDRNEGQTLSNGQKVKKGQAYWVSVEPIRWIVDEEADIMITENILFAGVRFNDISNYQGDFNQVVIKNFMDSFVTKEIEPLEYCNTKSNNNSGEKRPSRQTRLEKMNPDTTEPENRRKMTYTELIHNWIEGGESVLLRGPSGIGKTERIKSLYPDLVYLKLVNNMFPEKVLGTMNLQTGEDIPPNYVKQLILSCATEEEKKLVATSIQNIYKVADTVYERSQKEDKKQVLLLDELLNVRASIQSLVYTLVLNRLIEVGSGLNLPKNVVIVATGNQKKFSSAAEDLVLPLEKRFDHILDMEPRVGEWLYEYAIPNHVHPVVKNYILGKYIESNKSEKQEDMGYFYEDPEIGEKRLDKNNCRGKTNDPRGWVSVSTALYNFEKNLKAGKYIGKDVEYLLKMNLSTKLREEWANNFYQFYNIPVVNVEDVIGKKYREEDLPQNSNERFACLTSLLLASEEQVDACRDFIREYCDKEYLTLYELTWMGDNEERMKKIIELRELDHWKTGSLAKEGGMKR